MVLVSGTYLGNSVSQTVNDSADAFGRDTDPDPKDLQWYDTTNVLTDDSNFTYVDYGNSKETDWLEVSGIANATVPWDAKITGIVVTLDIDSDNTNGRIDEVTLYNGATVGDDKGGGTNNTGDTILASRTDYSFGGSGDLWGLDIYPEDLSKLKVRIAFYSGVYAYTTSEVYSVKTTIYYTVEGSTEALWWCPSLDASGASTLYDFAENDYSGILTDMNVSSSWVADTENSGIRALDFDGLSGIVLGGSTITFGTSDFTATAWIKASSTLSTDSNSGVRVVGMMGSGAIATTPGWQLHVRRDGSNVDTMKTRLSDGVTYNTADMSNAQIGPTGEWLFVSAVYDEGGTNGNNFDIFGGTPGSGSYRQFGSTHKNQGTIDTTTEITIGGVDTTRSSFFKGQIDDVRIFKSVLATAKLNWLSTHRGRLGDPTFYNGLIKPASNNLADIPESGWWCPSLDDLNTSGVLIDDVGTGKWYGKFTNVARTDWINDTNSGGVRAISLSDTSYIDTQLPLADQTAKLSISIWLKTSVSLLRSIVSWDETTTRSGALRMTSTGKLEWFSSPDGTTSAYHGYETLTSINDGNWHHLCMVFDGTRNNPSGNYNPRDVQLFIDNVEQTDATWTGVTNGVNTPAGYINQGISAYISNGRNASHNLDCDFDDCRIYFDAIDRKDVDKLSQSRGVLTAEVGPRLQRINYTKNLY